MKQISTFTEMVIYITVNCQSYSRQGKAFYKFASWNSNGCKIKRRNIQSIQQFKMCHAYILLLLKPRLEKDAISAGPK